MKTLPAGQKPLNIREERFCQYIANGMRGRPAAKKAGYTGAPGSLDTTASRLLRKANVSARVEELRAKTSAKLEFTRESLARHLFAAATTPVGDIDENSPLSQEMTIDAKGKKKVRSMGKNEAARLLCEMMGWKEPEKHVVDAGPTTLDAIRKRALEMASPLAKGIKQTS